MYMACVHDLLKAGFHTPNRKLSFLLFGARAHHVSFTSAFVQFPKQE